MTERSTSSHLETIHHEGFDPDMKQVYVPAIKMKVGNVVFISGVTAAPPYHHHPHRPEEFGGDSPYIEGQVEPCSSTWIWRSRRRAAALGHRGDEPVLHQCQEDQDVVNAYQGKWFRGHIPTSTSVEVKSLATDPNLRLEISVIAVAPPEND